MARRKHVKRIDPRYFMDEKMERLDEASQEDIDREFDCKAKLRETLPKEEWSGPKGKDFMEKCRDGRLDEVFGFGNKAKRRKELEGFIEQYDVRGFLTQLMRAVTSGERLPDELEDLADLVGQDSVSQRQQLKTLIRQGGALEAFAKSLGGDYDNAVAVIQNIVQEAPEMFNALMRDAAAKVGPMASPEQKLARSHG